MGQHRSGDEPVPGYRVQDFLGRGSYGEVWKATGPGRVEVALKFISLDSKQGLKEFKSIGLVKRLRHPNLVPIHAIWLKDSAGNVMTDTVGASGEPDSVSTMINLGGTKDLVIAMGLGDKSLMQRLEEYKGRGIPPRELIRLMEEAARGIDFLNDPTEHPNDAAIIHCDIKPANLLIVGGGVQVCDYGVARALSNNDIRKTFGAGGTPAYAAPELINNDPSPQTDQYSLAITYIELRTGQLPFDETKALVCNLTGKLDLSLLEAGERDVIKRATHMQPGKRFESVHEMVEELKIACGSSNLGRSATVPVPGIYRQPAAAAVASAGVRATADWTAAKTARTLSDALQPGEELVPDHRLIRLLGQGGFGQVWEATGPGGLPRALKVVRYNESKGQREFDILTKIIGLKHPNLMRLHGYWLLAANGSRMTMSSLTEPNATPPSAVVISTDLAEQNLADRLRDCQNRGMQGLELTELIPYMRQAASALDFLNHDHNIRHRDIKPENILLEDGAVRISDFGLAKLVEDENGAVHSTSSGMTLDYAAPELLQKKVTLWTDEYSLALTYIVLRTGRLPYPPHASPEERLLVRKEGRLDLSALSPAERDVLLVALNPDPSLRYYKCTEMVTKLSKTLGLGTDSYSALPPVRPSNLMGGTARDSAREPAPYPPARTTPGGHYPTSETSRTTPELIIPLAPAPTNRSKQNLGTMNFGDHRAEADASATPVATWRDPLKPAEAWTDARKPGTSSFINGPDRPTKSAGMPAMAWVALLLVIVGGAGGAYLLMNGQENGAATTLPSRDSNTKPSGEHEKPPPAPPPPLELKPIFDAARDHFQARRIEEGLQELAKLPKDNAAGDALQAAWRAARAAADTTVTSFADLDDNVKTYPRSTTGLTAADADVLEAFHKKDLAAKLAAVWPALDSRTKWDRLAAIAQLAERTTAVKVALVESWIELKARNADPDFALGTDGDLTTDNTQPPGIDYAQMLIAAQTSPATAAPMAVAIGTKKPDWLKPHRSAHLVRVLQDARKKLRREDGTNLAEPYAASDAANATAWIRMAEELAALPGSTINQDDRLTLQYECALAAMAAVPPDLAAAGQRLDALRSNTGFVGQLTVPAQARFHAMIAATRGPTAILEAVKAYRKVVQLDRDSAGQIGVDYIHKMVVQPITGKPFFATLTKGDGTLRGESAKLMADLAREISRNPLRWDKVLDAKSKATAAFDLYSSAAQLSKSKEHLAWRGITRSELPIVALGDLEADLSAAKAAGPEDVTVRILDGIVSTAMCREHVDNKKRFPLLIAADASFRAAIASCDVDPKSWTDELTLLYKKAADNLILLANGRQADAAEQRRQLRQAVTWADALVKLDNKRLDAYDTKGCALEDLAWLLKSENRFDGDTESYPAAVKSFRAALDKTSERSVAAMHRGRCLFKWAEDKYEMRKLDESLDESLVAAAEADFVKARDDTKDEMVAAECHYWLARAKMIRHRPDGGTGAQKLFEAAQQFYAQAIEFGRRPAARDWFEPAVTGLASAYVQEIARLKAVNDKTAATEMLARLAAMGKANGDTLAPQCRALLEVDIVKLQTSIAGQAFPTNDVIRLATRGLEATVCLDQHRRVLLQLHLAIGDAYDKTLENPEKALAEAVKAKDVANDYRPMPPADRGDAFIYYGESLYYYYKDEKVDSRKLAYLADSIAAFETGFEITPPRNALVSVLNRDMLCRMLHVHLYNITKSMESKTKTPDDRRTFATLVVRLIEHAILADAAANCAGANLAPERAEKLRNNLKDYLREREVLLDHLSKAKELLPDDPDRPRWDLTAIEFQLRYPGPGKVPDPAAIKSALDAAAKAAEQFPDGPKRVALERQMARFPARK